MAPIKLANKATFGGPTTGINGILQTRGVSTRSRNGIANTKIAKDVSKPIGKRKAGSPLKEITAKRAAFGDITNAITKTILNDKDKNIPIKKVTIEAKTLPTLKVLKQKYQENIPPLVAKISKTRNVAKITNSAVDALQKQLSAVTTKDTATKVSSQPLAKIDKVFKSQKVTEKANEKVTDTLKNGQRSNRSNGSWRLSEASETSLYVSALEDISNESKNGNITQIKSDSKTKESNLVHIVEEEIISVPEGVSDFDKDNWNDPFQVSHYAMDIFNYLKSRESDFTIVDYMPRQKNLSGWMRALLIDWMVEVQESFELNHETLYLAVKLVDMYLCKEGTGKEALQLLGAASLFVAAKFDERVPPLVDDFLYVCDGAYTLKQLLGMEINVLKTVGFDLGIPLSYRFLRRYARCARASMPTLTLARYVLELCLMEYAVISLSDSKMAAAALYLAIRMKKLGTWTPTHVHYTGYTLEEILPVTKVQNLCLHKKPKEALSTVRNKYSHRIFFEVAKVPLVDNESL